MSKGFSRIELEEIAEKAVAAAREAGYTNLPHNVLNLGPLSGECWAWKGRTWAEGLPYRRFAGWLRKLVEAHTPALDRLISRTASHKGIGSKHNHIDLWRLAERWGSPEAANRGVFMVRRRANEILGPFGLKVSYIGLAAGMESSRRIGKAAFVAAEQTARNRFRAVTGVSLNYGPRERFEGLKAVRGWRAMDAGKAAAAWIGCRVSQGEFSSIREAQAQVAERLIEREDDGIAVAVDRLSPVHIRHGLELRLVYSPYYCNGEGWLVVNPTTGETYHAYWHNTGGDEAAEVRYAVRQAVGA